MKYLLVIDDQSIRSGAFAQAEKFIKKLDKLETDLESFHDRDQRLFSSWYELAFRDEKQRISDYQDEYRALCKFHNWMLAVSELQNLSLPRAFAFLKDEEERFAKGSEKERAEIEKIRLKRDQFIRREVEEELGYDPDSDPDDFESEEEEAHEEAPELKMIREMSDQKLQKLCRDRNGAFALLSMCLNYSKIREDYKLLIRVWECTPAQYQQAFSKIYTKETGHSLPRLIDEIRRFFDETSEEKLEQDDLDEVPFDDNQFDDEFIRSGPRPQPSRFSKKKSGEEVEALKLLYRKLVRELHPDLKGTSLNTWQKKMWDRVQEAYRRQDKNALERLFRMLLVRNRSLNELSLGEILESKVWLKEEFENLSREAKRLKKLPAWGFSRRKDYGALKRKLGQAFYDQLFELSERVEDLKLQHEALKKMSESRTSKPQTRTRKSKPPRSRHRTRDWDFD